MEDCFLGVVLPLLWLFPDTHLDHSDLTNYFWPISIQRLLRKFKQSVGKLDRFYGRNVTDYILQLDRTLKRFKIYEILSTTPHSMIAYRKWHTHLLMMPKHIECSY
jgi:hypothetical protein